MQESELEQEVQLIMKGEIAIFVLKLSSKFQIGPSTIKTATLVLEFAISVQSRPLSDVVSSHR